MSYREARKSGVDTKGKEGLEQDGCGVWQAEGIPVQDGTSQKPWTVSKLPIYWYF